MNVLKEKQVNVYNIFKSEALSTQRATNTTRVKSRHTPVTPCVA